MTPVKIGFLRPVISLFFLLVVLVCLLETNIVSSFSLHQTNSTGVEWTTLNPNWNATWKLLNVTDGMELQMQIKDKNKMMVDTALGRASLVLGADLEGTQNHVIDIWKSDTRRQGQLFLEVC
jgi:Ca2+-dependent lipid-binding protein